MSASHILIYLIIFAILSLPLIVVVLVIRWFMRRRKQS